MAVTKEKILKPPASLKNLIKSRAKKAPPLSKIQKKLNKLHISLTKIVLEEREKV